jgi:hypothetical protein
MPEITKIGTSFTDEDLNRLCLQDKARGQDTLVHIEFKDGTALRTYAKWARKVLAGRPYSFLGIVPGGLAL